MDKELTIGGMHCHHCIHAVRKALAGVEDIELRDVEIGRARVQTTGEVDEERIREALADEGYELEEVS